MSAFFGRIVIDPGFPGGSAAKNLSAMPETHVRSLAWEDFLEEEKSTPFHYPCLGNPWTEEPGGLQSMGSQRVGLDSVTETTSHRPSLILNKERHKSHL